MVTIAGNGMGGYTFDNLPISIDTFDRIICDKNFLPEGEKILKVSYKEAKAYILDNYTTENILYVVTGSPLFFSAGTLIAKQLPPQMVRLIDNTSSKQYMLSHCIVSENDTGVLSIHGRAKIDLTQFLTHPYTLIVCDKESIGKLQNAVQYLNPDDIEVTIGYKLGYKDERIERIDISQAEKHFDLSAPYVLLVKRLFTPMPPVSEDDTFATERGMITKQYKRHLSLQHLDLLPNMLLWDIGAGSGSCAIEAYKRYRVRTVLFEKQPQRCSFIKTNLSTHHVCDTRLLEGNAETLFESIAEDPDRIFVGGGGERVIERLPYLYERLCDNGVMLISAITLKNLAQMITVLNMAKIDYRVISLSLTTYKGALDMIEPERQLFQIKIIKQCAPSYTQSCKEKV
jgi:precorrin-6Y C5,15-methyltransferase (decarboxylating)